jgi:group II intron reverse transcriptase/maturase
MIKMFETQTRTVPITQAMVKAAYRKVKANQGAGGVDKESLEDYEANLSKNLYVLWNRLSSGSYFPKPLRTVTIPKTDGKQRVLGIPAVSDRIAQQVVKDYLEPRMEAEFSNNSYGYRPLKSAHQAVEAVQKNVRQYAWVIDMDIKSFFDEVNHELLLKAIDRHVSEKWVKMYLIRWLECPAQQADGTLQSKAGKGTPQGGVISPLLANLFLHYVLDKWIEQRYPQIAFVRYADDVIVHCHTEEEAKQMLEAIKERLAVCKLSLSETKTKLVYCKDYRRKKETRFGKKFDFLGFTFKPRTRKSRRSGSHLFLGYGCAISEKSQTRIRQEWARQNWHRRSEVTIQEIAEAVNARMRGIIRYYGKFELSALQRLMYHFERRLVKWVLNKYKRFKKSRKKAYQWLKQLKQSYPTMFYYWTIFKHV